MAPLQDLRSSQTIMRRRDLKDAPLCPDQDNSGDQAGSDAKPGVGT